MIGDLSVISPATVAFALVGGAAAGVLMAVWTRSANRTARFAAWRIASLGTLFYVGRFAYSVITADPGLGRLVGSYVLWLVFAAGAGIATYLRRR